MAVDVVIKNGKVVSPTGINPAGVAVDNGMIVDIADEANLPEAKRTIDAKGNHVLPGVIDAHTHFGVYAPLAEDLKNTEAAVCGGITTVNDSIGLASEPAATVSYLEKIDGWIETWNKNSLVDGVFSPFIMTPTHIDDIPIIAQRYGILTFKFLMAYKGEEAEQLGIAPVDDGQLYEGFKAIAGLGPPARAMIHAENMDIIHRLKSKLRAQGKNDLASWTDCRPGFVEALDVERAISIARVTGCPLYQVHTSAAESVEIIAKAKAERVDYISETCPPYLTLTKDSPVGLMGKVNPPWKDQKSIDRLWQGLRDDTVSCLGTDCCPHVKKEMKGPNIWDAYPGYSCIESYLPIMLSEGVNKGRITLERLVEVACSNNAKAFGIYPKKGTISVGSDADLVIIDLDKKVKLSAETHHECQDFSIYEGWEVKGYPVLTMVRGTVVMEDGEVVGKPGTGRYIPGKSK